MELTDLPRDTLDIILSYIDHETGAGVCKTFLAHFRRCCIVYRITRPEDLSEITKYYQVSPGLFIECIPYAPVDYIRKYYAAQPYSPGLVDACIRSGYNFVVDHFLPQITTPDLHICVALEYTVQNTHALEVLFSVYLKPHAAPDGKNIAAIIARLAETGNITLIKKIPMWTDHIYTILYAACKTDDTELFRNMISGYEPFCDIRTGNISGAIPNNNAGRTLKVLVYAVCSFGSLGALKILIQMFGHLPDLVNFHENQPIFTACAHGKKNIVDHLLTIPGCTIPVVTRPNLFDMRMHYASNIPSVVAANNRYWDIVELILDYGHQSHLPHKYEYLQLDKLVEKVCGQVFQAPYTGADQLRLVQKIDKLCSITRKNHSANNYYGRLFVISCKSGNVPLLRWLLSAGASLKKSYNKCLKIGCASGSFPVVEYLFSLPYKPIWRAHDYFLLQHTCASGSIPVVRAILEHPDYHPYVDDNIVLVEAARQHTPELLDYLLKFRGRDGFQFDLHYPGLKNFVEVACENPKMLHYVIQLPILLAQHNNILFTQVCEYGTPETLKILLNNPEVTPDFDDGELLYTVILGHDAEMLHLLINDPRMQNNLGPSFLQNVVNHGTKKMVRMLLDDNDHRMQLGLHPRFDPGANDCAALLSAQNNGYIWTTQMLRLAIARIICKKT